MSDKKDKINKDLKIKTETDINNKNNQNNQNKYFPYLTSIDYKYYKNKNKGDIKKRPISHDKNNHCFNFIFFVTHNIPTFFIFLAYFYFYFFIFCFFLFSRFYKRKRWDSFISYIIVRMIFV